MMIDDSMPPDAQARAAIRRALGPLGCQVHAALLMVVADLVEIQTGLDPAAQALAGARER